MASASDAIDSAKRRVAAAEKWVTSASQMLESAQKELTDAKEYLTNMEEKLEVVEIDSDSDGDDENDRNRKRRADQDDDNNEHKKSARNRNHSVARDGVQPSTVRANLNDDQILINVIDYTGGHMEILPFVVKPSDIISTVKNRIRDEVGIPPHNQHLRYKHERLGERHSLSSYGIEANSSLYLTPLGNRSTGSNHQMKIKVRTSRVEGVATRGGIISLNVKYFDTIQDVKIKIQEKKDIPHEAQSIKYQGIYLDDCLALSVYNIRPDSHLVLET